MSDLLVLAGVSALMLTAVSFLVEFVSWRRLEDHVKAQQREIRQADTALHAVERAHKRRLAGAQRTVEQTAKPQLRAKYGRLELYDDRIKSGSSEFVLTPKTKPRVVGRGRGDERTVMVLLEEVTWARSLSATKTGKEHEFEAERFAADVRVLAPNAAEARAVRAAAVTQAQRDVAAIASDTTDVEAAREARERLGVRLKAAGRPPGRRWRRAAVPTAVVALVVGGALSKPDSGSETATPAAAAAAMPTETTPTKATTPAPGSSEPDERAVLRAQARRLVNAGDYVGAQDTVTDLAPEDRNYVLRFASARAARVIQKALGRSDRASAARAVQAATDLPATPALTAARRAYRTAVADAQTATAQKRTTSKSQPAREAAIDDADPDAQHGRQTCAEIGHSFQVAPGSDPDHDRDGDGLACESQ